MNPSLGVCFDRSYPAGQVVDYAKRVEAAGLSQLWFIEDCFYTAGISLAAAALATTESITVGLGILPVVARNPAVTAMELATLAGLGPGRLVAGMGHGIQEWMGQIGARKNSPLTVLTETFEVVGRLLDGETLTYDGRYVTMAAVELDEPPAIRPDLVAGVNGPKSMAAAGRVADGLILAEGAGPAFVDWALDEAGRPENFTVDLFSFWMVAPERETAYKVMAPVVAAKFEEGTSALTVLPFFDEARRKVEAEGPSALLEMPVDYWNLIGAIGTIDDAAQYVNDSIKAGARSINFFPGPSLELGHELIEEVAAFSQRF